jgi:hypothetical protein
LISGKPLRLDVEAQRLHLSNLVLARRHYLRHVRRGQHLQATDQFVARFGRQIGSGQFLLHPLRFRRPMMPHLVVQLAIHAKSSYAGGIALPLN